MGAAVPSTATEELEFTRVNSADGVSLLVVQAGNKEGRQVLLLHGFSQSYLSWHEQLYDANLTRQFQLVAIDLRGHGASEKPAAPSDYTSEKWAADVAAIIAATGSKRPVLVGWSMGALVAASYIKHRGVEQIGGINLVGSPAIFSPGGVEFDAQDPRKGTQLEAMQQMQSDDIQVNRVGTSAFVSMLTSKPPAAAQREMMSVYNMMTPAYARRAMLASYTEWRSFAAVVSRLRIPVLISHGACDALVASENAIITARAIHGARTSIYPGVGHAPFLEDAPRFNQELAEFVMTAQAAAGNARRLI